jgi:hypothetical protein
MAIRTLIFIIICALTNCKNGLKVPNESDEEILLANSYRINLKNWIWLATEDTFDVYNYIKGYYFSKNYCGNDKFYANVYICSDYIGFGQDTVIIFDICSSPIDSSNCMTCRDYSLAVRRKKINDFFVPKAFETSLFNNPDKYKYLTGNVEMLVDH